MLDYVFCRCCRSRANSDDIRLLGDISQEAADVLIKRRAYLWIAFWISLIGSILSTVDVVSVMSTDNGHFSSNSVARIRTFNMVLYIISLGEFGLIITALWYWHVRERSAILMLTYGAIKLIFPVVVLLIPLNYLIQRREDDVVGKIDEKVVMADALIRFINALVPAVLLANALISAVSGLRGAAMDDARLLLIGRILAAVYIPQYTMAFLVGYQLLNIFSADYRLIILTTLAWVGYTAKILCVTSSKPYRKVTETAATILVAALLISALRLVDIAWMTMFTFVAGSIFSYITISIVSTDFVLWLILDADAPAVELINV